MDGLLSCLKEGLPAVVLTAHFFQKFFPILAWSLGQWTQQLKYKKGFTIIPNSSKGPYPRDLFVFFL